MAKNKWLREGIGKNLPLLEELIVNLIDNTILEILQIFFDKDVRQSFMRFSKRYF